MESIKWGILSTAKIALKDVIPAIKRSELGTVHAICSRDPEKAKAVAEGLDIPVAYSSYEDLLADEEIDAIYNPLPNHLHVPWTLKALEAGKHVLCEKPITPTLTEAEDLLEKTRQYPDLKVMEAFMYRFHPQWTKVKELVSEGVIGDLKTMDCIFTYYNDDPDNIRNKYKDGGGGLLDIGCYCVSAPRFIFGEEPVEVKGYLQIDPEFGVDHLASGLLRFNKGMSTFTASMEIHAHQNVKIFGTKGHIDIPQPFNPPAHRPSTIFVVTDTESRVIDIPAADQYTLQCDAFARSVIDDSPVPTPLEDAVANMRILDRIRR
ncbi:Gfo/Idh/MocA family protein [Balneola sp. MJW-20]|uniref:Gfo/Idh/MocA family protein n=1 Tax=Gracilimonas aurantiaca TaxID=3234185 RepID=UPI003467B34A